MAMARVLVHGDRAAQSTPERLLETLNNGLVENILLGHFVTACYAVLDPDAGRIDYALAGHPLPTLVRASTGAVTEFGVPDGPPLGISKAVSYRRQSVSLEPGDALVIYTDGMTEARPPGGELLEEEGVLRALESASGPGADALLARLIDRMRSHLAGSPNDDDVTILVVRRDGPADDVAAR